MNTILIIEDHPEVREPLARILKYEGYHTVCASNGAEALGTLAIVAPDLVLLDLVMPRMDGLHFLESMRQDMRFAHLPVILMTGLDGSAVARAKELGAVGVISKSKFTIEGLLSQIRSHLALHTNAA
jgi:CheY-like chemotaxis protein